MSAAGIQTMMQLRRLCPMNGSEYRRVQDEGLSETQADRWSVRLGLVPWQVWPEWGCVPCALTDCGEMFVPRRPGHVYHDQKCARKAWARTPEGKASLRAAKARWLETAWEYDRRRERERKRRLRAERRSVA